MVVSDSRHVYRLIYYVLVQLAYLHNLYMVTYGAYCAAYSDTFMAGGKIVYDGYSNEMRRGSKKASIVRNTTA
jgi:hypothetical protein